jgi:cyclopropane fatty-acyl-phospholipid synthase-like methyltransferase
MWSAECAKDFEAMAVLEDAMLSGKGWRQITGIDRKPDYQLAREDAEWAEAFTFALYDAHLADAEALASSLDLSAYRSLLDVGGGSGVMSLALARSHPHLKASILDFEFVCGATNKIIRKERMSRRVKTIVGDMNEAIPSGFDIIMFWDIGRIDTRVIRMAYDSLPLGGMLVRSCRPSPKPGLSPGRFLREYLSVRPENQSKIDKIKSLKAAGFSSVKHRSIGQGLGMITALKR